MIPSFPDPDTATEYDYVNDEGLIIRYTWDGEKWLASGVSGGVLDNVDTRHVQLVNAISAFAPTPATAFRAEDPGRLQQIRL